MDTTLKINSPAASFTERSLSDYFEILIRRKWVAIPVFVATLVVALGMASRLPSIYQASATLSVEDTAVQDNFANSSGPSLEQRIYDIAQRVFSDSGLALLVEELDLYPDMRSTPGLQNNAAATLRNAISLEMNPGDFVKQNKSSRAKQTSVSFALHVSYPEDPEKVFAITERIVKEFVTANQSMRKRETGGATDFLTAEVSKLEEEAATLNFKIAQFRSENNGRLPEQLDLTQRELDRIDGVIMDLDRQMFDLRQRETILTSELSTVDKYLSARLTNEVGEEVLSNKGRIRILKSTYVTLLSKYSEKHPKLQKLRNEIMTLGGNLDFTEARGYVENEVEIEDFGFSEELNPAYVSLTTQMKVVGVDRQSLLSQQRQYRERRRELERNMMSAPPIEAEYNRMTRAYDSTLVKLNDLGSKLNQAEMATKLEENEQGERFTVINPPRVPMAAASPNRRQIAMLGLMLAFAAAFLAALVRESTDRTLFTESVMEKVTGVKPLGVIPVMNDSDIATTQARSSNFKLLVFGAIWLLGILALAYVHLTIMPLGELVATLLG